MKTQKIKKSKSTQTTLTLLDIEKMMNIASITHSEGNGGPNEEDKEDNENEEDNNDYNDDDAVEIEEPTLSDDDLGLLHEEALILIDELIKSNQLLFSNPDFETIVYDHVQSILHFSINYRMYDDDDYAGENNDCDEDEDETVMSCQIEELINVAMHDYFKFIRPHRSYKYSFIRKSPNLEKMKKKIEFLESLYQPEQKTDEWYSHRHGLVTASSVWKAFGSQSVQNQLIYEKCMPFDPTKYSRVNTESPLHWGQKYEVLSKQLYEEINGTKVQ